MYSSAPSIRRVTIGHDDALVYPRLIHEADDRFRWIVPPDPVYMGVRIYDHLKFLFSARSWTTEGTPLERGGT